MTPVKPDPVAAPAPEVVRAYARKLIRRSNRARRRLGKPDDPEALHDFRVGLRRLRSHLRAYRPFQAAGHKAERRLKDLAGRTNPARDIEVALAWLDARREQLAADETAGAERLAQWLGREHGPDDTPAAAEATGDWDALARDLEQRLARDPDGAQATMPFGAAAAACLRAHADRLRVRLATVQDITDQEEAHQARIAAKRLRYLLEPLAGDVDGAKTAVRALTALQDILGEMHDRDMVIAHLGEVLREAAAERADRLLAAAVTGTRPPQAADPEAGLLKLATLAVLERADRFQELRDLYLSDGGAHLLAPIEGICASLERRAGG